jgi:hypothetical protein
MGLSLDLAAMDGGHAEKAGAFFGHANEVFSHLKAAQPLMFSGCYQTNKLASNAGASQIRDIIPFKCYLEHLLINIRCYA